MLAVFKVLPVGFSKKSAFRLLQAAPPEHITVRVGIENLFLQVVKGLRGGVQDVALKMLLGEAHYQVNSFRQVH